MSKPMKEKYLIAVDGGGTKTIAVMSDLKGRILKKAKTGSTNPNKIGFEKAIFNLKKIIFKITKGCPRNQIGFCYLGLAGGLEKDKEKKKKIEKFLKKIFSFPIKVEGDQKIAFRSGTDEIDGVLIIAGTGSISMGWRGKKEEVSGGWDWLLGDQGSAFWIGKKALEEAIKTFDGRRKETLLRKTIFQKLKIKNGKELYQKFYQKNFVKKVASISVMVDEIALKGNKTARKILEEAGKELNQMALSVIKKLKFRKQFPLVLVGEVFNSKFVFQRVKKEIKKYYPQVQFIRPKKPPIFGGIKIALENFKEKYANFRY